MYAPDTTFQQKDRLQNNMKEEIKKLQRYRDAIKGWLSSSEVKDKSILEKSRKDIEKRMENFKKCEKEAKTKAFSKEGLGRAANVDPRDRAKHEMRDWLSTTVETLNSAIEGFEAELEDLGSGKQKKGAKPPARQVHLEESISRHKQHIVRLEQVMRLLDNDELSPDDVEGIKDLVEDYLERNQDDFDEFGSPDDMYEELLDQLEGMTDAVVAAPPSHTKVKETKETSLDKEKEEKERERQKAAAAAVKAQLAAQGNTRLASESLPDEKIQTQTSLGTPLAPGLPVAPAAPAAGQVRPTIAPLTAAAIVAAGGGVAVSAAPPPPPPSLPPPPPPPGRPALGQPMSPMAVGTPGKPAATLGPGVPPPPPAPRGEAFPTLGGPTLDNGPPPTHASAAAVTTASLQKAVGPAAPAAIAPSDVDSEKHRVDIQRSLDDSGINQLQKQLAVMGLSDAAASSGLTPAQSSGLLAACAARSIPQPADMVWHSMVLRPRPAPVPLPPSYPTAPLSNFENPALYEKLDVETLFFAFYFRPGSRQQLLAARELKKQAWRFHKEHSTWFQRHEEPKAGGQPGDDWEQGNYVYFDSQLQRVDGGSGWCYRLKQDFVFQYEALEDELVSG